MGIILKQNMRATILIFALLGLTLTAAVSESKGTNNALDTCLKNIKTEAHENLQALNFGLNKNWLDMAKHILTSGADAIESYELCTKVQMQDALDWVSGNCSQAVQTCVMMVGITAVDVQNALKTHDMKDVLTAVSALDQMFQA